MTTRYYLTNAHGKNKTQMSASYQASLVNRHIRRFTGITGTSSCLYYNLMDECLKERAGGEFNKQSCRREFIKYFIMQLFFGDESIDLCRLESNNTFVPPLGNYFCYPVESNKLFPIITNVSPFVHVRKVTINYGIRTALKRKIPSRDSHVASPWFFYRKVWLILLFPRLIKLMSGILPDVGASSKTRETNMIKIQISNRRTKLCCVFVSRIHLSTPQRTSVPLF